MAASATNAYANEHKINNLFIKGTEAAAEKHLIHEPTNRTEGTADTNHKTFDSSGT